MKRSGFRRKVIERAPVVVKAIPVHLRRSATISLIEGPAQAVEKESVVSHEGYRRLVATLPCARCGAVDISQAAHPNTNKGASLKTDDRKCFPLCCDQPLRAGCHPQFDQGALYPKRERRELEVLWGQQTRTEIRRRGLWPVDLEDFEDEQSESAAL